MTEGTVGRVAALYDIHGNAPALEAVLADVRAAGAELIVVGGDVIPGPMPMETIALLRDCGIPIAAIQGNGDREVLLRRAGIQSDTVPERFRDVMTWVSESLRPKDVAWIATWPATLRLDVRGLGSVLFCHATPRNDLDIFTRLTPEEVLRPIFEPTGAATVVCGHTHMAFSRTVGAVRVVNPGSVGMPFGDPGAYWMMLDGEIVFRHTEYDLADAAVRVRATAYPQAEAFAAGSILAPPTEEAMLTAFAKVALS